MRDGDSDPTIHVISLGCSKAQVDAESALGSLHREGYRVAERPEGADLVVVNTCSFIRPAIEESLDSIVEMGDLRKEGRIGELVVSGCLVDRFGEDLPGELPEVDRFLGSGAFREWASRSHHRKLLPSPGPALPSAADERVLLNASHYAYVKIAEGCDRNCAFCTIPSIRGRQRSRPPEDVLAELEQLGDAGVREAVLVSQDTVRWGRDLAPKHRLADLLTRIEATDGAPDWVRLHYLYPEPAAIELVAGLAGGRRVVPYVDVPVQHAADGVLARMGRGHRARHARELLDALREVDPDVAIRTTVIVGHPGERPEDVDLLCDFLEEAAFEAVGVFTYWDEDGTLSADQSDPVEEEERHRRAAIVEEVARETAEARIARRIGDRVPVLVDGRDPLTGEWIGRHAGQAPDVDGVVRLPGYPGPAGRFIEVDLVGAEGYDLIGRSDAAVANSLHVL